MHRANLNQKRGIVVQARWWACAVVLLAGVAGLRHYWYRTPPEAEGYLRSVIVAVNGAPTRFGSWVSTEATVPDAAVTMLRPNVTFSRRYTNLDNGQEATLLLIQCRDARDLLGHYPPICYVANGFKLISSTPRRWNVDNLSIDGMVYRFSSTRAENMSSMVIYDFMILPDGSTCRDMDGVYATARDPRKRQLGAAQMQILVDANMGEEERDALFQTLVRANRKSIDAILAGVEK